MNKEKTILRNLIANEEYCRKVLPFLDGQYFLSKNDRIVFEEVARFVNKYKNPPTFEALKTEVESRNDINDDEYLMIIEQLDDLAEKVELTETEWLVDMTEGWCRKQAVYNAIQTSISIQTGENKDLPEESIPKLLQDALAVSFDTDIGHDYFDNAEDRWKFYNNPETKIPFDIDLLNVITKGGLTNKTLNVFIAATGGGKSMVMCHCAASYLAQGKNVLYITLEMSEEEIGRRIDANLFDIAMDDVDKLSEKKFMSAVSRLRTKAAGTLKIKQYPPHATHAGHYRHLLRELEIKKKFKPDVILIDYITLCRSSHTKHMNGMNYSTYLENVAQEIRGLGIEFDCPIITAAQFNREGMGNSEAELTDIALSIGITFTADLALAIINSEEMTNMKQVQLKQLKNRYGDENHFRKFVVGLDKAKAKMFNLGDVAQQEIVEESREIEDNKWNPLNKKRDFTGWKV